MKQYIGRKLLLVAIIALHLCGVVLSGKILVVHPIYASSNALTLRSVAESIVSYGHHIDIIVWKDEHTYHFNDHPNISVTTLSIDNSRGEWMLLTKEKYASFKTPSKLSASFATPSFQGIIDTVFGLREAFIILNHQCNLLLSNKQLHSKLQKKEYDLAIVDTMYNTCGLALVNQLKLPVVGYWAMPFSSLETEYTTAFLPASHVPAYASGLGHKMDFYERTHNLLWKIASHLMMSWQFYQINAAIQYNYPGTLHPTDLLKNLDGMLIYADPVLDYPRLLPPTFINIGGVHIRNPKPLPKDINDWIENSGEHGVILLSMGFTHDLKNLPQNLVNSFMAAIGRFPQKFIVKFEETINATPPNVKILKWIPQQDILAHRKIKAFITHCGTHGVLEGAYNGVPMIGLPISLDHGEHCAKIKERGMAIVLNIKNLTQEIITQSLKEILSNPTYKINAEKISRLMKSGKESPQQRLMDFIDYVILHKGTEHLKLSSRHLHWIQYYSLDSVAFLGFVFFLFVISLYKSVRFVSSITFLFWNGFKKVLSGQTIISQAQVKIEMKKHN